MKSPLKKLLKSVRGGAFVGTVSPFGAGAVLAELVEGGAAFAARPVRDGLHLIADLPLPGGMCFDGPVAVRMVGDLLADGGDDLLIGSDGRTWQLSQLAAEAARKERRKLARGIRARRPQTKPRR